MLLDPVSVCVYECVSFGGGGLINLDKGRLLPFYVYWKSIYKEDNRAENCRLRLSDCGVLVPTQAFRHQM